MAETLRLARRLSDDDARARLRRLGAERFEPARLSLWRLPVGTEEGRPLAWLLAAETMSRALLLPDNAEPAAPAGNAEAALMLDGGPCPSFTRFERWWLWERLARPGRWSCRVLPATPGCVELPLWLGYSGGRHTRLLVISGLSGEPLVALKSTLLASMHQRSGQASC
ncbi:hypothetical protein [Kushneria aurantia]|uniref:Uncharacterized protein n=1 Tax=Kushneria aurantia TaxID=504092 RepID=A0ABV6FZA6_9GAMM|nr:hypothetical protein [Kushneria aurantia]